MKPVYKWIIGLCAVAFVTIVLVAMAGYSILLKPNFSPKDGNKAYVYLYPEDDFDVLMTKIDSVATMSNSASFLFWAKHQGLTDRLRSGRYGIRQGATNREVVNMLLGGMQEPLNVTFNNIRLPQQLAARLGEQMMLDSAQWMATFTDSALLANYQVTTATLFAVVLPNTYEMYWNMTGEQFMKKMATFSDSYWNEHRIAKAEEMGLTRIEVTTLASIVEEETNKSDEKPVVAGLYLNRLHRGMLLQSDPTVKFAVGDFTLTQILNKHLAVASPYNTYLNQGLPPGPIRMASLDGIDAVLNYTHHNYIYMCAKPELNGRHNFAATLAEHNHNAALYHQALRAWLAKQK